MFSDPALKESLVTEKEITLVRLAQKGDTRAFDELVALHDSQVMNLAMSLLGSKEDAADVYQDIFIRVFKALNSYRFESELSTWLYRVTVNACLSFRKSRGRQQSFFPKSIESDPEPLMDKPQDAQYEADSNLLQNEMSNIVKAAIDELPPQQKTVVILRHYQNKKIREIADIMELNEGTVKGYLFRAMQTLKDKLEPYMLT